MFGGLVFFLLFFSTSAYIGADIAEEVERQDQVKVEQVR